MHPNVTLTFGSAGAAASAVSAAVAVTAVAGSGSFLPTKETVL